MEEYEDLSEEELNEFEEANIDVDENASEVNEGLCDDCNEALMKIVENKNVLDGSITFHIIKLKCPNCGKTYLDLNQAEKYNFLLALEKAMKQKQSLESLSKKIMS